MTCKAFTEAVTDYMEGVLRFPLGAYFQMHVASCPGCSVYLRQMQQMIDALGRLPVRPPSPAVRNALLQRFRSYKPS